MSGKGYKANEGTNRHACFLKIIYTQYDITKNKSENMLGSKRKILDQISRTISNIAREAFFRNIFLFVVLYA